MVRRREWLRWVGAVLGAAALGLVASGAEVARLLAICGAYEPEIEALHREFEVRSAPGFVRSEINGLVFWRGSYAGKELVVFRTGTSLVNAAYQLQLALDRFPITHILFAGVAGGIDPALHVGDVVIPERWAYHAESTYVNEDGRGGYVRPAPPHGSYENYGMIFPAEVGAIREGETEFRKMAAFPVDADLLAAARRAVPKVPPMRKAGRTVDITVGGTGVAGPVFLDNAKYREWVFRVWRARCLDMESTALAQVAYANRKPILIVRGLSDLAGAQHGTNPIDANEAQVSQIAARVLRAVIDEL